MGMFRVGKLSHPDMVFNFAYFRPTLGVSVIVKIWLKMFSAVLTGNDRNNTTNSVSMFWVQNRVIWDRFSTLPALVVPGPASMVPGPGKVIKIWSKIFLAILTGNDTNCTPNSVDMFRLQNRVIHARFSTLPAPVKLGPGKVVKIRPKPFSLTLTENDKNWTTKCVGMFWMQNRVIGSGFQNPYYGGAQA